MIKFEQLAGDFDPSVPDLSPGVANLLSVLANDDIEIDEVASALELYPVICARLIGLANSAWSSPDSTVTDLKSTCVRLGLGVVKSSAIAYAVAAPFDPTRCRNFDPARFWCCSLLAAEAADRLAGLQAVDASLARTGAMLRNLGLVWLADAAPAATEAALALQAQDGDRDLASILLSTVGASHLQASHHLFSAWELPDELLDACDPESTSALASICHLSSDAAVDVHMGTDRCSADADAVKTYLEKSAEKIASIAQSIAT